MTGQANEMATQNPAVESVFSYPVGVLVGRQNVGKSTLFNLLIGKRLSIVSDEPGVTRDRIAALCKKTKSPFLVMDMGGWIEKSKNESILDKNIREQIQQAIKIADFFIFVLDNKSGLLPEDMELANLIRKTKKRVIVVVNKTDGKEKQANANEFHRLGFENLLGISALQKINFKQLVERLNEQLPESKGNELEKSVRVALTGRPNVGKSSLLNAILGEKRAVVSPVPGTTRDSVDEVIVWKGHHITLVDTAGLRKKSRMSDLEYYGSTRTLKTIKESDVTFILLDAETGIVDGDKRIAQIAIEAGCGLALVINKMDLIEDPNHDFFLARLFKDAPFLKFSPVIFLSALKGEGVEQILKLAVDIQEKRKLPLAREILQNVLFDAMTIYSMPSRGGRSGRVYDVRSVLERTHKVEMIVNDRKLFAENYMRLLERHVRVAFDLDGVSLHFRLLEKNRKKIKSKKNTARPTIKHKSSRLKK